MAGNKRKSRDIKIELGEQKLDEVLKASAARYMFEFKLEYFKKDHPRLYQTIKDAMTSYAIECINYIDNENKI